MMILYQDVLKSVWWPIWEADPQRHQEKPSIWDTQPHNLAPWHWFTLQESRRLRFDPSRVTTREPRSITALSFACDMTFPFVSDTVCVWHEHGITPSSPLVTGAVLSAAREWRSTPVNMCCLAVWSTADLMRGYWHLYILHKFKEDHSWNETICRGLSLLGSESGCNVHFSLPRMQLSSASAPALQSENEKFFTAESRKQW